jgi:hypothetical protein
MARNIDAWCQAGSPRLSYRAGIRQVKAARALLGWSQEDLANACAVSLPYDQ